MPLSREITRTALEDALYAITPPLEALRVMVSRAATADSGGEERELMVNDVSRAYSCVNCTRDMYIELPPEDPKARPDLFGRLRLCLYDTRDAALNWQSTLSEHLTEIGFIQDIGHPSVFRNATRDVWTLVHGDDYSSAGKSDDLDWFH